MDWFCLAAFKILSLPLSFHSDCGLLVVKATRVWGSREGKGIGQVRRPQSLLFLLRLSYFPSISAHWIAESLWLISMVLKMLILTVFFANVLTVLWMRELLDIFTLTFSLKSFWNRHCKNKSFW